jgi:hypothetical protein
MNKVQRHALEMFKGWPHPASKWEVFGATPGPAVDVAIHALCDRGYLFAHVDGPRDRHGGTRYSLTNTGRAALGLPPLAPPAPKSKTPNGKRNRARAGR